MRRLPYLRDAKIITNPDTLSKTVDILVEVEEVWSIYPIPIPPSGGSGFYTFGALITDMNFMRRGGSITLWYFYLKREILISMLGINFYEPRLFGTRWSLNINPSVNVNNPIREIHRGINVNLNKPLYAIEAKWGINTYAGYNFNKAFWYDSVGKPTKEYNVEHKLASFSLTRSFGLISKKDIEFGISANLTDYPNPPESLEDSLIPRDKYGLYASLSYTSIII